MSSTEMTRVCPDEQVDLTCISNGSLIIRWEIRVPSSTSTTTYSRSVPIDGDGTVTPIPHLTSNGVVNFNFPRVSEANTHPLISKLVIDRFAVELNGTEIICLTSIPVDEVIMTTVLLVLGKRSYNICMTIFLSELCRLSYNNKHLPKEEYFDL